MKRITVVGVSSLVGALLATSPACARPAPTELVIRAGRLLDGTGEPARERQRIHVADGLITAIESDSDDAELPHGAELLDARSLTVMPGLINSHTHLFASAACRPGQGAGIDMALRNAYALLAHGVTTVADLGAPPAAVLGLRRWVGTARQRGPRVLVAGPVLTAAGGYLTDVGAGKLVDLGMVVPLATADEARRTVRRLAEQQVDFIKVGLQEKGFDFSPLPLLKGEVLCAVVDEAHEQDLKVLAHAVGVRSYRAALTCGVDAIMHAATELLPQAIIDELGARAVPVVPTLFVFAAPFWGPKHLDFYRAAARRVVIDDEVLDNLERYAALDAKEQAFLPPMLMPGIPRKKAQEAAAAVISNTRRLFEAGVPLAFGSDGGNCMNPLGSVRPELSRMVEAGLSRAAALQAATSGSASLLGLGDALGQLKVGYRADIIGVSGRPEEDLGALDKVRLVIVDGVVQNPEAPGWSALLGATFDVIAARL